MTISVAIAAYRGEKFIGEELQSISDQQIVPDEVVICDDSPDDLTEESLKKFSISVTSGIQCNWAWLKISIKFLLFVPEMWFFLPIRMMCGIHIKR